MRKQVKEGIIGIISGLICGLFAAGGGLILVPTLITILKMDEKIARGTAICAILPMVLISSIYYISENYMDWKVGILAAIGGIVGGWIGAKLLKKLPVKHIRILFAIFLIFISIRMLVQ